MGVTVRDNNEQVLAGLVEDALSEALRPFVGAALTELVREEIKSAIFGVLGPLLIDDMARLDFDVTVSKHDPSRIAITPKNEFTKRLFKKGAV